MVTRLLLFFLFFLVVCPGFSMNLPGVDNDCTNEAADLKRFCVLQPTNESEEILQILLENIFYNPSFNNHVKPLFNSDFRGVKEVAYYFNMETTGRDTTTLFFRMKLDPDGNIVQIMRKDDFGFDEDSMIINVKGKNEVFTEVEKITSYGEDNHETSQIFYKGDTLVIADSPFDVSLFTMSKNGVVLKKRYYYYGYDHSEFLLEEQVEEGGCIVKKENDRIAKKECYSTFSNEFPYEIEYYFDPEEISDIRRRFSRPASSQYRTEIVKGNQILTSVDLFLNDRGNLDKGIVQSGEKLGTISCLYVYY